MPSCLSVERAANAHTTAPRGQTRTNPGLKHEDSRSRRGAQVRCLAAVPVGDHDSSDATSPTTSLGTTAVTASCSPEVLQGRHATALRELLLPPNLPGADLASEFLVNSARVVTIPKRQFPALPRQHQAFRTRKLSFTNLTSCLYSLHFRTE